MQGAPKGCLKTANTQSWEGRRGEGRGDEGRGMKGRGEGRGGEKKEKKKEGSTVTSPNYTPQRSCLHQHMPRTMRGGADRSLCQGLPNIIGENVRNKHFQALPNPNYGVGPAPWASQALQGVLIVLKCERRSPNLMRNLH